MAIYAKPCDEWTPEEAAVVKEYEAEIERRIEEKRRKDEEREEERRKLRAESDARSREYWKQVYATDKEAEAGTMDWFLGKLKERTVTPEVVRVTNHPEMVPQYLTAAYIAEVERHGGSYRSDAYTQRAISDVSRWLTSHTKPGLLLRGYVGVGKTTIMRAAGQVLAIAAGKTMQVYDARAIANLAKNDETAFEKLIKEPLLGIDDLGTEPATVKSWGNELSPVAELLTQRYVSRRFTVITTNLTVKEGGEDELREVYGERLFDRFREAYNFINYDAKQISYRRQAQ